MKNKAVVFTSLTYVVALTLSASSGMFTSLIKVERMIMEGDRLSEAIDQYTDRQYDSLRTINTFLSEKIIDVQSKNISAENLSHPNVAYHVIKNFAATYTDALGDNFEIFRNFSNEKSDLFLADDTDIEGVCLSLARLQMVYNLSIEEMIKGDYLGVQGPPLSAADVFDIGVVAYKENAVNESIKWISASLQMYASENFTEWPQFEYVQSIESIKATLAYIYLNNGDIAMATSLYEEAKQSDPSNVLLLDLAESLQDKSLGKNDPEEDHMETQIVCRYREALIPYYRFKEELLSIEPFVSVIYDFISDRESEHFKTLVRNQLSRAKVYAVKREEYVSSSRTGQLGWLADDDSQVVRDISLKIQHVTGLYTTQQSTDRPFYTENFQVVNYGIGGHYDAHTDAIEFDDVETTGLDRVATFLIFLNNVDRGGSTVFTELGLAVAPRKNMALFWYNYNTTNGLDQLTIHGGCPVLLGQKWIANKWISSRGNIFRRRCGLKPNATQLGIEKDMKEGYK